MGAVEAASHPCPGCGTPAFADARFCAECGAPLSQVEGSTRALAGRFVVNTAREAGGYGRAALQSPTVRRALASPTVQKVTAGAAVGAVAAALIPFVSMGAGAVVGGGYVAARRFLKRDRKP